jgi:hypothetical protein
MPAKPVFQVPLADGLLGIRSLREDSMTDWTGWPLERLLYLFLGLAYTLLWMQLTLMHWRGGFHNRIMWGPVIGTPFIAIAAFLMTFMHGGFVDTAFVVLFALGVLEGIIGTVMHLRGDARQVGGLTLRNIMSGPPPILPFVYMALSALGLAIHFWPRIVSAS